MDTEILQQIDPGREPVEYVPPPLMIPGYAPVAPRSIRMASVHFLPCRIRFMHSNRHEFYLAMAKKDEVTYCTAYDSQQYVRDTSDKDNAQAGTIPMPVSVESIIDDMEREWCFLRTGREGLYRLGVGRIAGKEITEQEKAALINRETLACRALVEEADRFHVGAAKGEITSIHRQALDWLGSEKKPWYKPIELGRMKKSVVSGLDIPVNALADAGSNLVDYYVMYDLNPLDYGDTHIAEMLKKKGFRESVERRLGRGAA